MRGVIEIYVESERYTWSSRGIRMFSPLSAKGATIVPKRSMYDFANAIFYSKTAIVTVTVSGKVNKLLGIGLFSNPSVL